MPALRQFDACFEREQGGTDAEWRRWLPGAVRNHALQIDAHSAHIAIGTGHLHLAWTELAPRRIALLNLPRLQVRYRFDDVDAAARARFMQFFDLYLQRGGG